MTATDPQTAGDPVTSGDWLEEQLQRALTHIDTLQREVTQLQSALLSRQQDAEHWRHTFALLEARTQRSEANVDLAHVLEQEVAALQQRLEEQTALCREQTGASERTRQHDAEALHELGHTLSELGPRIQHIEERLASIDERQRRFADDLAVERHDDGAIETRFETLERQLHAMADIVRRDIEERSSVADALPELRMALDIVEARTRVLQQEQQRLEEESSHAGPPAPDSVALEAADQQRALRARTEERLGALEQRLETIARVQLQDAEEQRLLQRQLAVHAERLQGVVGALEAQRESLLEHFQRATLAAETAGARQVEEIERQVRAGRELLKRLTERSDGSSREQPL